MPRSRTASQLETRERLLDAAHDEFSRRPVNDVSLDDIAKIAGFTKGAVYANFTSKSDLLLSVLERRMTTRGRDYIDIIAGATDDELAADVGTRAAQTEHHDHGYFRIVAAVWAEAVHDPELASRFRTIRRAHRTRLSTAIRQRADDAGITLHVDPDDLAAGLLAMSMATMIEALIDPDLEIPAIHAAITDHVLAGVLARSNDGPTGREERDRAPRT